MNDMKEKAMGAVKVFVSTIKSTKWHAQFEQFGKHANISYASALPSIRAAFILWLSPLNSTNLP